MSLPEDFAVQLAAVAPVELARMIADRSLPRPVKTVSLANQIKPIDLYCYLGGRFGPPNGFQNVLRGDSSDNLIHWEWALRYRDSYLFIQGHNFRTDVLVLGALSEHALLPDEIAESLKADMVGYRPHMAGVRRVLEHWIEFVNPYQRVRRSVARLFERLALLDLDTEQSAFERMWNGDSDKGRNDGVSEHLLDAIGIAFGVRAMLPIVAESFVNLLLYVLLRPDIKNDTRLRDNVLRQPIDVRIKSLAINCVGFHKKPDYSGPECKKYHALVNARNDLLHGNVVIDKLRFGEVFFFGRVPVYAEYRSAWERSMLVEIDSVGLVEVHEELAVVDGLIDYLLSCVKPDLREDLRALADSYKLGLNSENQRIGVLFPPHLVEFRPGVAQPPAE